MLPIERQSVILSKLAESDSVRTAELATILSVTDETIRKRSEEHTSELQSRRNLVCRLLLEKKKTNNSAHTGHQ